MRQISLGLVLALSVLRGFLTRPLRWVTRPGRLRILLTLLLVPVFVAPNFVSVPPQIAQPVKPAYAAAPPEPGNPRDPLARPLVKSGSLFSIGVDVRTGYLKVQVVADSGPGLGQAGKIVHSLKTIRDPETGDITGQTWVFNHELTAAATGQDAPLVIGPDGEKNQLEFDHDEPISVNTRWAYHGPKGGPWFLVKFREKCVGPPGESCGWSYDNSPYYEYLAKGGYREFDATGRITIERDGSGNQATYDYTSGLRITDEVGRATTYSSVTNPATITDPYGRTLTFLYNADGRMTRSTNIEGGVFRFGYTSGRLTSLTDPRGNVYQMAYAGANGQVTSITYPDGSVVAYSYEPFFTGLTGCDTGTVVTDPRGNVTRFCIKTVNNGRTFGGVRDALGNLTFVTYDTAGNISRITDALSRVTTFAWTSHRRLTRITDAQGKSTTYTYDANDNLTTVTDALGHTTTYAYDANQRLIRVTNALNQITTYTYTAWGGAASATDARGNTTTYEYDARHRVTRVNPPAPQGPTTYTYDTYDNPITVTDALGHTVTAAYDAMRRKTSGTDALGNVTRFAYDPNGNQTSVTDPKGQTTTYTYDNRDRVTAITQPGAITTSYAYDPNSNLLRITLPSGATIAMAYDARDLVTQVTDPLGRSTTTTYDAVGNVATITDRKGVTTTISYDTLYRVTSRSAGGQTVSYTYDDVSNRLTMTDPTGTTAYQYDALDRLSRVTWPDGRFIAYAYDAAGNKATMTNPAGQATAYAYDGANRITTVTDPTGTTTFGYDAAGNRTALTLSNGASTTYTYNANNWLLSLVNKDRAGATASQFTYTYDPNGNRTQIVDQSGASAFAYDARNQLTQASYPDGRTVAYTYDGMGNRSQMVVTGPAGEGEPAGTTSYAYDAASRLLQRLAPDGTTTFAYDQNGNLLTYAEPSGTRTFGYDVWDQMTSVTSGSVTVTYTYDGGGQKVRRQGPSGAQRYYYDYFSDVPRILAEADAGSGTFQTIYQRDLFGNLLSDGVAWHQFDGLGSIVSRTNSSGALVGSTLYGAWGTVRSQSGTQGKWGFTGAEWDPDAKGYLMGTRWYDPSLGRWWAEDPAGAGSRGLNAYAYAAANPLLFVDPTGLEDCDLACQNRQRNAAAAEALAADPNNAVTLYQGWLAAAQAGSPPPPGWAERGKAVLPIVMKYSEQYDVPPALILAIIAHESAFNPNAINRNKNGTVDIGLMQINSATAKGMGIPPDALWDPDTNIKVGTQILARLLHRYRGYSGYDLIIRVIGAYHLPALAQNDVKYISKVYPLYCWFVAHGFAGIGGC